MSTLVNARGKVAAARLDSLTGLRFVAALAIVIHHASVFTGWQLTELSAGVSLFFVLSGFVLTWSCGGMPARIFWRRRVARIVPIYLVAGVIGLVLPGAIGSPNWRTWLTSLTLTQAWFPNVKLFLGGNGVAWSLSVEAFFYALFPLLWVGLERLSKFGRRNIGIACTMFVLLTGLAPASLRWLFYIFPLGRLPEFVVGMVAAMGVRDGWRPKLWPATMLLLPGGALAYLAATPSRYDYQFAMIASFALLIPAIAAGELEGRGRLLKSRPMVALGSASYALYLFHQLVIRGVEVIVDSLQSKLGISFGTGNEHFVLAGVAVVLAIAVADVVHRRIEVPLQLRLRGEPNEKSGEPSPADLSRGSLVAQPD